MVWWDIGRVQRYRKVNTLEEMFDRKWGYGDERGGVGHAGGILRGAEDGDAVIGGAERLDAFVGLLAVVQGGSHAVEAEAGICDEFWSGPLAGVDGVVGFDVAVDFADSEADIVPIYIAVSAQYTCGSGADNGRWQICSAYRPIVSTGGGGKGIVDVETRDLDKQGGLSIRRSNTACTSNQPKVELL